MPGYRFSEQRLQRMRLELTDGDFICRPASTNSGCTVIQAVNYGGTPGCGIGRRLPRPEKSQLFDDAGNVAIGIDGIRFEYLGEDTQRAAFDNADDWLYEFQWQPKELAAANSSVLASQASWLIFADGGGVGDALSALLEARGERSILVTAGSTYEQIDDRHYRVRPERPEDISQVVDAALASGQPKCRGVIHLWSLDVAGREETTVASLSAAQSLGCGSVLLPGAGIGSHGIGRPSSAMADYAGCSGGRGRTFPR